MIAEILGVHASIGASTWLGHKVEISTEDHLAFKA